MAGDRVTFGEAVRSVLGRYATFTGRARRAEYWWFHMLYAIASVVPPGLVLALDTQFTTTDTDRTVESSGLTATVALIGVIMTVLFLVTWPATFLWLALIVPMLAVSVRRLHDTSRSGWWLLLSLVPLLGGIVLLVLLLLDSTPGANQHGPDPKGVVPGNGPLAPEPQEVGGSGG